MGRCLVLLSVLCATLICSESAQAQRTPAGRGDVQPLEWNVFLGDWQLLGPFPKADDDPTGLVTQFVKDESNLSVGRVTFYDRKLYTWRAFEGRTVDFRKVLGVPNSAGNEKVAYALTQFSCSKATKARLSVG